MNVDMLSVRLSNFGASEACAGRPAVRRTLVSNASMSSWHVSSAKVRNADKWLSVGCASDSSVRGAVLCPLVAGGVAAPGVPSSPTGRGGDIPFISWDASGAEVVRPVDVAVMVLPSAALPSSSSSAWMPRCSDLRTSGRLLDNSAHVQLTLMENIAIALLTLSENRLTLTKNSLKTSLSAHTH
jgi:hypothetical protein